MMRQLTKYRSSSNYDFETVWKKTLFPWEHNSINDLMTAVLIEWYETHGGKPFVRELYRQISNNPKLSSRYDYATARDNWYRMVSRASQKDLANYFEQSLKWPLSQSAKNQIANEIGSGGDGGNPGGDPDPVNPVPAIKGNLLSNASFEDGVYPWYGEYGARITENKTHRATGETSLYVYGRTKNSSGAAYDVLRQLEPGGKYLVKASFKLDGSGSDKASATLMIFGPPAGVTMIVDDLQLTD